MSRTVTVTGMSCGGCEANVVEAVEAIDGVASASADNEADELTVDGDVDDDELRAAVSDAGYEPAF